MTHAEFNEILTATLVKLSREAQIPCPTPVIKWDLKGTSTLGLAYGAEKIRLHPEAALKVPTYADTVIHEACHVFVAALAQHRRVFTTTGQWSAHGLQWQAAMRRVGVRPNRCGSLPEGVKLTPARNIPRCICTCGCTKEHTITHARALNGMAVRQRVAPGVKIDGLICRFCKSTLTVKEVS